jgi:UDP-3-O-[3-hydroxymyristoyl] glucosamine N-acyltransferase
MKLFLNLKIFAANLLFNHTEFPGFGELLAVQPVQVHPACQGRGVHLHAVAARTKVAVYRVQLNANMLIARQVKADRAARIKRVGVVLVQAKLRRHPRLAAQQGIRVHPDIGNMKHRPLPAVLLLALPGIVIAPE